MSKGGGPVGFLGGLVHNSHTITLILGFIGLGSLQALITQYFEPLIEVYWSFLLTFPLTLGLTILFLILANSNLKKIPVINVLAAPVLLFVLFFILNSFAEKYKFAEQAEVHAKEKEKIDNIKGAADRKEEKLTARERKAASVTYYENIREPDNPWYKKVPFLGSAISASYGLVNMFIDFYHVYKPMRFFSGIVLALLFVFFIQTKIIKPYRSGKNKVADTASEHGSHDLE